VGEAGIVRGDVGLRGAGAEKVGVTNGETGAGAYTGILSAGRGRGGTPDAGQTLSHMCSGVLSCVGEEARRNRLGPASGDDLSSSGATGGVDSITRTSGGYRESSAVSEERRTVSEDSDNNRSRISCKWSPPSEPIGLPVPLTEL
jgi:hypothetical protein